MVFVLDKKKRPLMPCSEKRARLLLQRRRAVVHRLHPFTIRLKDRLLEESALQPVGIKLDPGSKVTGVALVRREETVNGPVDHALHLSQIVHRGEMVHERMRKRASYRRRRRSANLRYRAPRFNNRTRSQGWLAPSLKSRVENVLAWVSRYRRLAPISFVDVETVRFDTQALQNPEISGVEYQRGELFGCEVREYLLEKWGRRCAYCGAENVPLEIEHIVPKSRGGSDRVSNLTLACRACNQAKGNRTAEEFGHAEVQAKAKLPLKDAAAVNTTRDAIRNGLSVMGLAVRSWTGGRTKYNRLRFGIPKTHALDALCVGDMAGVSGCKAPVLEIKALGRGQRCRTNVDAHGFPRGYRMRHKTVRGFRTGDLVRAEVPNGKWAGTHVGFVAVRASESFRVGKADGISWKHCRLLQRADGYGYKKEGSGVSSPSVNAGASVAACFGDRGLRLATLEEMVLIKAYLLTERGALRDYVDLVALVDKMGFEKSLTALDRLNELYPSRSSLTRRLRLAEALCRKPADADDVKLSEYKGLITPYDQEEYIYERGRMLAASLARRELERQSEKRLTREQEEGRVR